MRCRYAIVKVTSQAPATVADSHDADRIANEWAEMGYRLVFVDHGRMWLYFERELD